MKMKERMKEYLNEIGKNNITSYIIFLFVEYDEKSRLIDKATRKELSEFDDIEEGYEEFNKLLNNEKVVKLDLYMSTCNSKWNSYSDTSLAYYNKKTGVFKDKLKSIENE